MPHFRLIGPHFIYLVEKEKLAAEEYDDDEGYSKEDRLMVMSDCGTKYNCDLRRKLMLYLGSKIARKNRHQIEQQEQ